MCNNRYSMNMGFTNETYDQGTHMCLVYNDDFERKRIIGKFLESGLLSGEKVDYFIDEPNQDDIRGFLKTMDIDVPQKNTKNLNISEAEKTYCPEGVFIPERMLNTLRCYYDNIKSKGYPGCRISGEMSWALREIPGTDRIMEYEAMVNKVLETHPITAICQYNADKFDGYTILECLEVHPYMIVHGLVVHNPFYKKPEEFLEKSMIKE